MPGSIAGRLIRVLILCAAVVLGSGLALDYSLSRQAILERLTTETRDRVAAAVVDLDNLLYDVQATTRLLASLIVQAPLGEDAMRQLLRDAIAANRNVFGGSIALMEGATEGTGFAPYYFKRNGALDYRDLNAADAPYGESDWFAGAIASGAPRWSEPYFDAPGGGVWMTTYSVPVFRSRQDGERVPYAVITADITLDALRNYLTRLYPGGDGFGVLLSKTGTLLSAVQGPGAPGTASALLGGDADLEAWSNSLVAITADAEIVREIPCPQADARDCRLHLSALASTGWPVGIVFSPHEVLAPLRNFALKTLLIGVATLLAMALAVVVVSRRLLRPLSTLAQASNNIARGELDIALPQAQGRDEVAQLVTSFALMREDLQRYISDLQVSTAARSRMEAELAAAADIQMAMLPSGPQALEQWQTLRLWAGLRPAKSVGGDLYTYSLRGDRLFFAVGDVSDKGVPAALFMAKAIGLLQPLASEEDCPARVLERLNSALCEGNENCMFLTLSLGVLNLKTLALEFASAGHPAPLLLRGAQVSILAQDAGPALGLAQGLRYTANRAQLAPTDRLAVYTDGLDEAFDTADHMFGLEGLIEVLRQTSTRPLALAGSDIIAAVDAHCGAAAQSDDITLLLLQCGEREGESGEYAHRFSGNAELASRALSWLRDRLGSLPVSKNQQLELELLAEEIITNIEKYAELPADGHVDVVLQWHTNAVTLEFTDDGRPFDPLQANRHGNPADPADIGGLGVHLIQHLAKEQHYQRVHGRNLLRVQQPIQIASGAIAQTRAAKHPNAGDSMQLSTTVSIDAVNSVARVALNGALNTETAPAFEHRLQDVLAGGEQLVVLDMRDLDYISSAGLRVIFKAAKQAAGEGRRLAAANRKPHIDKVFEILRALPDMAVFADDQELDAYLAAMQQQVRDGE